jgi:hypothetical protein
MGCGNVTGGTVWTLACPPGHRIVGYAVGGGWRVLSWMRFYTARFADPPAA